MLNESAANAINSYMAEPFGYKYLPLYARYVSSDETYITSGEYYTPAITSRNPVVWNSVDVNDDLYTYDNSEMVFPLPYHRYHGAVVEAEYNFEGIYELSGDNSAVYLYIELWELSEENGEIVETNLGRNQYRFGVPAGSGYLRVSGFGKTYFILPEDDIIKQMVVKPVFLYNNGNSRIDICYGKLLINGNLV